MAQLQPIRKDAVIQEVHRVLKTRPGKCVFVQTRWSEDSGNRVAQYAVATSRTVQGWTQACTYRLGSEGALELVWKRDNGGKVQAVPESKTSSASAPKTQVAPDPQLAARVVELEAKLQEVVTTLDTVVAGISEETTIKKLRGRLKEELGV